MDKATGFFDGVKKEFRKITWPSRPDIIRQTVAVVIVSVIFGLFITAMDWGFSALINMLAGMV